MAATGRLDRRCNLVSLDSDSQTVLRLSLPKVKRLFVTYLLQFAENRRTNIRINAEIDIDSAERHLKPQ